MIVLAELENAGWRFQTLPGKSAPPDPMAIPMAIINKGGTDADAWLKYAENGGMVLWIDPDHKSADRLGLNQFKDACEKALMEFHPEGIDLPVTTQVFGSISRYEKFKGNILGRITGPEENKPEYPGMLEIPYGRGKILALLFSLSRHICHMHQRTPEIARQTPEASAEKISLQGTDTTWFLRPQLDLLIDYLSGVITRYLVAAGRPMPRLCRLPRGYKNMVTFSFDDISPSWKPLRKSLSRLGSRAANGKALFTFSKALKDVFRSLFQYPANYREQVRWMLELFSRYNVTASVYLLPFFTSISNRPQITGYKGFAKDTFFLLKNSGWDIGTHIKPDRIEDYAALHRSFESRFGTAPAGHRGHELGWVGWDEDWAELERLGYEYDTTWNWGGHDGLAWILGTSFPFHPVDRNRRVSSILEVPVTGWLEDLVRNPKKSVSEVEAAFTKFPGIYHFGGHSRLMNDPPYAALVTALLELACTRPDVGTGWNVAELVAYWKNREKSGFSKPGWDETNGIFSCEAQSACANGELTVAMPLNWRDRKIFALYSDDQKIEFKLQRHAGIDQVLFNLPDGPQRIEALYR